MQAQNRTAGGRSREDIILEVVVDQLERLPPAFDLDLARYMYPVRYEESMNSVLVQEMVRFNRLTDVRAPILLNNSSLLNEHGKFRSRYLCNHGPSFKCSVKT